MYSKKVYTGGGSSELGINYYFSIYHFLPKLYLVNPRRHKSKKLHEGIRDGGGGGGGVNWSPPPPLLTQFIRDCLDAWHV